MAVQGFTVSGRVQGVGFRAYVCSLGEEMGLQGGVWNSRTGDVEIVASHELDEVVDEFEAQLWNGPGRVDKVLRTAGSPYPVGPSFQIWPTR